MRTSRKLSQITLAFFALVMMSVAALAADPGTPYPATSEVSDQKAGSVLIYNIYTSGASGNTQNTRINITNTHITASANVHLFFVGNDCSVADSYICLTPAQTASFLASDVDPLVTGYIVGVAVDSLGCPINFNFLIGDEYVKFSSGHAANLGAEAFAAIGTPACDSTSVTAALNFSGAAGGYNQAPRVLAVSNIPSRADGNDTVVIINRVGGSLATGAVSAGTLFGLLYDDAENVFSYSFGTGCQTRFSFGAGTPRTTPRFDVIIPAGRSGWTKIYNQTTDNGILGAVINFNASANAQANAFNGGRNMHKLTLAGTNTYTIPVFPPSC
jgi:hypothetical protein